MSDLVPLVPAETDFAPAMQVLYVPRPRQRYWLHILLFLVTVFSTLVVGSRMQYNFEHGRPAFLLEDTDSFFPVRWALEPPSRLLLGLPFAGTLLLILMAHEMGHYLYCVYYGVNATLPFFIPAPTLIGTLGAFIRIRSPIRSRTALFDIGIAGPIAGFVVATTVLLFALPLSKAMPSGAAVPDIQLGYPLIFRVVAGILRLGDAGGGSSFLQNTYLHPTAIAAWVGMFATALNLLPGGQLDGGHIVFSIAPRAHKQISRLTVLVLIPMAIFLCYVWLVWAILLRISGMRHPIVPEWPKVMGVRRWLAVFAVIMLVLTLAPAPFAHSSLLEVLREWRSGQ
jgi:membrane-associated protease RseP (regulator of RpoE activity)